MYRDVVTIVTETHRRVAKQKNILRLLETLAVDLRTTEITLKISTFCSQNTFKGAFAKLRKATISFVMSVRPSTTQRLGSQ